MSQEIKERPILFNGQMVRAILEGRKTQTRRVIKPQFRTKWGHGVRIGHDSFSIHVDIPDANGGWKWIDCPFGKAGNRLWVRETHWFRSTDGIVTYADGSFRTHPSAIIGSKYIHADDVDNWPKMAKSFGFKSVPSIHMPRWASRIALEITGVRVERLQDISIDDATAEGITLAECKRKNQGAVSCYRDLWQSINGFGSWDANPWVWVVEYKRVNQ
jgi:hypothetical protein